MEEINDKTSIKTFVTTKLMELFPKYHSKEQNFNMDYINQLDDIFNEIEEIYNNRNMYNLHWAFDNAQNKINNYFLDIIERKMRCKLVHYKEQGKILTEFSELHKIHKKILKLTKRKFMIFSALSLVVSIVEIIISLVFVIVISELSHRGQTFISSPILSILFIVFFALLKVTLEKYYLSPKIEEFGWKLYKKAVRKFKRYLSISTSMVFVIRELVNERSDDTDIVNMLRTGISEIKK